MKLLVTGASGFIGGHLAEGLRGLGAVHAPTSRELDLTREDEVECYLRAHHFDAVVHAATWNATSTSMRDRSVVLKQNLRMFFALRRCHGLFGKLLYLGSGAEYDRRHWKAGLRESDDASHLPEDDYGLSKYAMAWSHGAGDPVWNLRLFGVYGPGEDWRIRFISHACCRALHELPITLRQNRRFDYTWVGDVVEGVRRVLEEEPASRILNFSAGDPRELLELALLVRETSGKPVPVQVQTPGMGVEYSADTTLLQGQLPGLRFTPIEEGVRSLYAWYEARKDQIPYERIQEDLA